MNTNVFEQATRLKLRFENPVSNGDLTVEQLWDLPLSVQASTRLDLNKVAIGVDEKLSKYAKSFVDSRPNFERNNLELQLEILKHIIGVKQDENKAKLDEAARAQQKEELLALRASKQREALSGLSVEEIDARLKALG